MGSNPAVEIYSFDSLIKYVSMDSFYFQLVANRQLEEVQRRDSKRRSGLVNSRSSEYFESILERRRALEKQAQEEKTTMDLEWKKQGEVVFSI